MPHLHSLYPFAIVNYLSFMIFLTMTISLPILYTALVNQSHPIRIIFLASSFSYKIKITIPYISARVPQFSFFEFIHCSSIKHFQDLCFFSIFPFTNSIYISILVKIGNSIISAILIDFTDSD